MTKGFVKVPHMIFESGLNIWEREMLIYILDCENRFQLEGDWVGLTDEDFINIGFGKDKRILKASKDKLISEGFIEYRQGSAGKKSSYKVTDKVRGYMPKSREEDKEFNKWLQDIKEDKSPGRRGLFYKGYKEYFNNEEDARVYVVNFLKSNKIYASI